MPARPSDGHGGSDSGNGGISAVRRSEMKTSRFIPQKYPASPHINLHIQPPSSPFSMPARGEHGHALANVFLPDGTCTQKKRRPSVRLLVHVRRKPLEPPVPTSENTRLHPTSATVPPMVGNAFHVELLGTREHVLGDGLVRGCEVLYERARPPQAR